MSRRAMADNRDGGRPADDWMRRAIDLARPTHPHPNPRVGAVVLSPAGEVLAEAAHQAAGSDHAEVLALRRAGDAAQGATLVVTLEPCDHHGATPPCTAAIVAAGVARVVVGALDPDVRVSGAGVQRLRDAGITVETGVGAAAARALDPGYFHHRVTGRPRVTLKLAATLDGQVAATDGTSQWITGEAARRDVHQLRAESDAVMVGAGTLRADDPRLDVRLDGYRGHQPRPVVVGGRRPLPDAASLYERGPLVYSPQRVPVPPGAELEVAWHPGGVDLAAMMKDLGGRGVVDLLVEGGPALARSLLIAGLVDRLVVYLAGLLAGGTGRAMFTGPFASLTDATPLLIVSSQILGSDLRVEAVPGEGA
jgi:diaminohydroxyphosphoribosylaminopyrimidine deaminase/5-amino-6-(5-phosphoribosylamino)uracil reductase